LISIEEVEHVAKLARLELTEEEKIKFTKQLGSILEYFKELNEVNTENIEPMAHPVPSVNVMRPDEITPFCERKKLLANAPQEEDGYFRVPKISED